MVYSLGIDRKYVNKMIRKVHLEEIPLLYPFVLKIFTDMGLPLLETIAPENLEAIIVDAMHSPRYRYGYENAYIYEMDGEIAGVLFGYPGEWEMLIDGPLQASMLNHGLNYEKLTVEYETLPGEWYLDTLVISPNHRRQGVATALIEYAIEVAKGRDYDKIALNCETDNKPAYRLYEKLGFRSMTKLVLSGHVYWHMTLDL